MTLTSLLMKSSKLRVEFIFALILFHADSFVHCRGLVEKN